MITKIIHAKILRMYFRDNLSIWGIARKMNMSRPTVRKWLRIPSGIEIKYHRTPPEKKINPFEPWLLQALESDSTLPKRDQRTVLELFDEIQKQGFTGCYSRVTDFVNGWRKQANGVAPNTTKSKEMQCWMEWLYSLEQPQRPPSEAETSAGLNKIYEVLAPSPNSPRTKALAILAKLEGFPIGQIAKHLAISRNTVRGYLADFQAGGEIGLFKRISKPRKSDDPDLKKQIFALLHEPPSLHGIKATLIKSTYFIGRAL